MLSSIDNRKETGGGKARTVRRSGGPRADEGGSLVQTNTTDRHLESARLTTLLPAHAQTPIPMTAGTDQDWTGEVGMGLDEVVGPLKEARRDWRVRLVLGSLLSGWQCRGAGRRGAEGQRGAGLRSLQAPPQVDPPAGATSVDCTDRQRRSKTKRGDISTPQPLRNACR